MNENILEDDEIYGVDYSSEGFVDTKGDVGLVYGIDTAKQYIKNWILTEKGFYPNIDDEYGSEIYKILGNDVESPNLDALIVYVENALLDISMVKNINSIEPHISISKISLNLDVTLVNGSDVGFNIEFDEV